MKYHDESLCVGKDGTMNENGDHIFNSQHFKAVFDGATPKGKRLWEGVPGDVYASRVLSEAMRNVEPSVSPSSLISYLNDVIKKCYAENGVSWLLMGILLCLTHLKKRKSIYLTCWIRTLCVFMNFVERRE